MEFQANDDSEDVKFQPEQGIIQQKERKSKFFASFFTLFLYE
jgi:hypothetical protein